MFNIFKRKKTLPKELNKKDIEKGMTLIIYNIINFRN